MCQLTFAISKFTQIFVSSFGPIVWWACVYCFALAPYKQQMKMLHIMLMLDFSIVLQFFNEKKKKNFFFCCCHFFAICFPSLPIPMKMNVSMCNVLNFDFTVVWIFFLHNLCLMNCIHLIMICDARSSIVRYFPISETIRTWYQFATLFSTLGYTWAQFQAYSCKWIGRMFANRAEKCKCERHFSVNRWISRVCVFVFFCVSFLLRFFSYQIWLHDILSELHSSISLYWRQNGKLFDIFHQIIRRSIWK